jgi:protein involved in polysaccharide export with SLBB domain
MKICLSLLPQLGALLAFAVGTTSCVQTWPADREFEARGAFIEEVDSVEEAPSAEDGLNQIPAEPNFKQLHYRRAIDPACLRAPSGPYRVGPGDKLDIEVAENVDTRRVTKVMPDGMLYYDVADGINVKGMSTREISTALATQLEDEYVGPVVSVNVANADSQRFWLLGQIKSPGAYPIQKPTTVIDAISQGGGLPSFDENNETGKSEAADLKRSILIRNSHLIPVNFDALIREGDMSQNVYIQPGDYLFIPSLAARSIYVLGEVVSPGPVFFEEGVTLRTAVATAGGFDSNAVKSKALILRGGIRDPKVAVVNIDAVMQGNEPDLLLEGGDLVWVPRTVWTKLREYTEAVLITAGQAVAIQESITFIGGEGRTGVTIPVRGGN